MKICFIFSNIHLSHLTGQSGIVFRLAKKVAEKENSVYIISNSERDKNYEEENISYFLFKGSADFKSYLKNYFKILSYLNLINPDVIHVHGSKLSIFAWFMDIFSKRRMVCSLYETLDLLNNFYRKLYIFCLKRYERVFVTADYIKNQLLKEGLNKRKVDIIRIGLREEFLDVKKQLDNYNCDVLYFGDSNKERGFDLVCKMAQLFSSIKFKLLIRWKIGCLLELKKMHQLENVEVLYYPYSEKLEDILIQSKIILLPYRFMAVRPPLSLIESMALGKCVITSSLKGNEEIIKDGYNGLIVNFNKLEDIVHKISFLIKNDQIRKRLGQKAKKTIKQMYSLEEYNKVLIYYSNLLKK